MAGSTPSTIFHSPIIMIPDRMSWGSLRVWNDDTIAPQTGFPTHPHRNMEIITYVRKGAITHRDSLGNNGRTEAGDVQVMSAGTGVAHSEYNREAEPRRFFRSGSCRRAPAKSRVGAHVPSPKARQARLCHPRVRLRQG